MAKGEGGKGGRGGGAPLWPFALIGLAGAVFVGLNLAVTVWKSWLLAGAILAAGMAAFWLIWPGEDDA